MAKHIKISDAQKQLYRLIRQVRQDHEPIIITHRGQAAAVLVSVEKFKHIKQLKGKNTRYDFSDVTGKLSWQGEALKTQRSFRDKW